MKNPILYLLGIIAIGGCIAGGGGIQPFGRFALRPIPDTNQSYSALLTRPGQLPVDLGCVSRDGSTVIATAPGGSRVTLQFKVYDSPSCSGEPCSTPEVTRIAQSGETIDVTPSGCLVSRP